MTTVHRLHASSVEASTTALLDRARGPLRLPKHIACSPRARPFLDDLIDAKPRHEWSPPLLALAVQCAELMAELAAPAARGPAAAKKRGQQIGRQLQLLRALRIVGWRIPGRPKLGALLDLEGSALLPGARF